ncbi:uncharacterized protein LOC103879999 isoform X3 [Papio anubis]|uniref:uncharacterized protein LOC103879999 isoform X3 n=1 Tax=Papio anubis TaxID=9555 RepID=UPI0012ADECE0|nr:uncharacterized protein LOC103879999 isoform X3 [Papio anubis]
MALAQAEELHRLGTETTCMPQSPLRAGPRSGQSVTSPRCWVQVHATIYPLGRIQEEEQHDSEDGFRSRTQGGEAPHSGAGQRYMSQPHLWKGPEKSLTSPHTSWLQAPEL